MSTQQDIYVAGSENRPPMLNKENYVPWSSRLLWYAKSRPNRKLIYNFIINGPYVIQMIPKPGDANRETILLGLPEDIYAAVDSCETGQEIWFTSTDGESIESYYHRFSKLMNNFKRNKHFPEKITTDYTQLYDFLKYNQKEVDDLRAERLAKTHDPLALMANSNNPFNYPVFHQDQPSSNPTTAMNMALVLMAKAFKLNYSTPTNNNQRISSNPRNRQIAQPGMNMGQDRQMQMVGGNGGNQFRQYDGQNVGNQNGYNALQNVGNQVGQKAVQNPGVQNVGNQNGLIIVLGIANQNPNGNGNVVAARAEELQSQTKEKGCCLSSDSVIDCSKEEAGIQLQAEEFDLMVVAADLDEIEEVNANCILMANLQQASTSGTQTDKAPVYDSDGSAEVHHYDNCYNNDIFNMFTQEEQYTELLEPIPEPHQVQHNNSNVIFEVSSVEQKAAEFVRDFKSLAKEADESLAKHKALELEIERLLRAVVSQDIMSIVRNPSVVDSSNL
ncbi:hypothetical protein Tco_1476100 [Tanacetum coccineum]